MQKIQNSATKKIRVFQIVMFLIQVLLTTQPYMRIDIVGKGEYTYLSVLKMLSLIGAHNDNGQYMSSLSRETMARLCKHLQEAGVKMIFVQLQKKR